MKKITVSILAAAVLAAVTFGVYAQTRQAKLTWGAVTQATDGSALTGVTYNVYQGAKGATTKPKVNSGITTTTLIILSGLPGGEVCFNISAQTAVNGEGALSNEACKSFPFAAPDTTTLTVQ